MTFFDNFRLHCAFEYKKFKTVSGQSSFYIHKSGETSLGMEFKVRKIQAENTHTQLVISTILPGSAY